MISTASGLYFSGKNSTAGYNENSHYFFREDKGLSELIRGRFINRNLFFYDAKIMAIEGLSINAFTVSEIPLPAQGTYTANMSMELGNDLTNSFIHNTSLVMQGKDLVTEANSDLLDPNWVDVNTRRYLVDGTNMQTTSFGDVIETMVSDHSAKNPLLTPEELEIHRTSLESGSLFFRSELQF